MRYFSIVELERFSSIKAHTIRMWEKRYGLFNPVRNNINIRLYTLEHVQLLLNLTLLNNRGLSISKLARLSADEIEDKVASSNNREALQKRCVHSLIIHMFSKNMDEFDALIDGCFLAYGIDDTIQNVIIPFLDKVQVLSYSDSSIEVHFIVTVIRRKIMVGIEALNPVEQKHKAALLFLPQGEHYDLVLLYMSYVLKRDGWKVLYLGTNISTGNLKSIVTEKKPDYIYTYISSSKLALAVKTIKEEVLPLVPDTNFIVAFNEQLPSMLEHVENVTFLNYKDVGQYCAVPR